MRRSCACLAFVLLAVTARPAPGAPGTSSVTATATVSSNCSVTTTPVAFNTYDPIVVNRTSALNGTGSVVVTCVKGTAPVIALSLGNYASGSTRRMSSGGDFLAYELYPPPGTTAGTPCSFPATTVWGNGGSAFSATVATSKAARSYYICGSVPAGQDPAIGTYTDTVVATVTF